MNNLVAEFGQYCPLFTLIRRRVHLDHYLNKAGGVMITIIRQGRVGGGGGASTLIRQGVMITIIRQGGDDYHNKAGAGGRGRGGIYLDKAGG